MIFSITQVYWLAGLVMAAVAVFNLLDASNPKRWTTGLFWGLYAVMFLLGDKMPPEVVVPAWSCWR